MADLALFYRNCHSPCRVARAHPAWRGISQDFEIGQQICPLRRLFDAAGPAEPDRPGRPDSVALRNLDPVGRIHRTRPPPARKARGGGLRPGRLVRINEKCANLDDAGTVAL